MSILDEKESTNSLKLIVAVVSIAACATFGILFALNGSHASAHTTPQAPATAEQTGNL